MEVDELIYWLEKEAEERRQDGGLRTNFDTIFSISDMKMAGQLYPSLINDEDANGGLSNARRALEEQ